jgi:hypothetical protein
MSISLEDELNATFVSNEKEFMGEKLAPYTEGSRLLLLQVRDDNDSSIYFIWSFIYAHPNSQEAEGCNQAMAWNRDLFREKIMEYIEGKTEADRDIATTIVSNILDEAQRGKLMLSQPLISPTWETPNASGNSKFRVLVGRTNWLEHRIHFMGHPFEP